MYMLVLMLLFLVVPGNSFGQNIPVFPHPQFRQDGEQFITLDRPSVLIGEKEADPDAVRLLRQLIKISDKKRGYKIYIGEKNDKAVRKYAALIPSKPGGYYLSVTPEKTVIAGQDERGTFYALQTLAQLLQDNRLPETEITDFPTVTYRGVVEGFYGQPWSHDDRIRQLQFYGQNKLNTYIYGPKDDPYHSSPNWRKPYPAEEAARIQELVRISGANKVDFVWAIHPGQDIHWNEEDRQNLLNKFEKMYELGVRSFAVFFDDISGEGTDPNRQAELLNYLDDHFVKTHEGVTPLLMCPTQYNKSWSDPKPGTYLDILGERLNPSVMIMWTGDRVISDITREGLEWVNKRIRRPAYVWWNFPVNDYVRDHLLMGPAYGLDTAAGPEMTGFVSNPMEKAEASKIAIFSIADYAWNPPAYQPALAWEKAIQTLLPEAAAALRTFAAHHSDPGKNGHKYRRDESVEIKPSISQFLADFSEGRVNREALSRIKTEFLNIRQASTLLARTPGNAPLIREIAPWLEQSEILGQAGLTLTDLIEAYDKKDNAATWEQYTKWLQWEKKRIAVDKKYNRNPYQPGVKSGSLVLQPFIDSVSRSIASGLYNRLSGQANSPLTYGSPSLYTDIEQLKNLEVRTAGNKTEISPVLEVIRIQGGQYIGIAFPLPLHQGKAEFNFNLPSASKWWKLQTSSDSIRWENLPVTASSAGIQADLRDRTVKYLRFTNISRGKKEFYLKKFTLVSDELAEGETNPAAAQDRNPASACRLDAGHALTLNNPAPEKYTTVCILSDPQGASLSVSLMGPGNNTDERCKVSSPFIFLEYPQNTRALRIIPNGTVWIYEVIWK